MSSDAVQLWRQSPVSAARGAERDDIDRRYVHPSARQALDALIGRLALGRTSFVGLPDYASHCVIDFVARRATPVPVRLLPASEASAVLLYDQWGWQRPPARLDEAIRRFPRATVIWDRVDSLAPDPEAVPAGDGRAGVYQLFSLSKTLGAGGGGLVWEERTGWLESPLAATAPFSDALAAWVRTAPAADDDDRARIDLFFRNETRGWPPALRQWLAGHSIRAASRREWTERRARLRLCLDVLQPPLRPWMQQAIDGDGPVPGILPLPLPAIDAALLARIRADVGLELCAYHFDYAESYLAPEWVRVLPVPLHSEVALPQLERLGGLVRSLAAARSI